MNDTDDLVRLLIRQRPTILAYAMSIVLDRDLADEVYQNVAVVVLRKADDVSGADEPMKWILGAARLECLSVLRKVKRVPVLVDDHLLDLLDVNWGTRLQGSASENEQSMQEALAQCIDKLTDRARKLLHLRYTRGLSGAALAEELQSTLNTTYVGLSRIHRKLRECVESRMARSE